MFYGDIIFSMSVPIKLRRKKTGNIRDYFCRRNVTIHSIRIVVVDVNVTIKKHTCSVLQQKRKSGLPFALLS